MGQCTCKNYDDDEVSSSWMQDETASDPDWGDDDYNDDDYDDGDDYDGDDAAVTGKSDLREIAERETQAVVDAIYLLEDFDYEARKRILNYIVALLFEGDEL